MKQKKVTVILTLLLAIFFISLFSVQYIVFYATKPTFPEMIQQVVLEPGGQISVVPKSSARPPNTTEMNLNVPDEGLTFAVIVDGKINTQILPFVKIDEIWLLNELQKLYMAKPKDVFYAEVDSNMTLYANLYREV